MHQEYKNFLWFESARFFVTIAIQMQSVALGWQMYALTHRPLDLGFIGLMQFIPIISLSLFAGQSADRFNRKKILLCCYTLLMICMFIFAYASLSGFQTRTFLLILLLAVGVGRSFLAPALQSTLPNIVTGDR